MGRSKKAYVNNEAILPGTLERYYNICGKLGCRCKDKENPQKHGPYYRLSYSIRGKNSSIAVSEKDADAVLKMTENYRSSRIGIQELALESVEIYRHEGLPGLQKKFDLQIGQEEPQKTNSDAALLRVTCVSRDKWKNKAMERKNLLDKASVEIRDLKLSRQKWKTKALSAQAELDKFQREFQAEKKHQIQVKKLEDIKKNGKNQKKTCA